jgi:glycosyltransferase involved in cell wall biosynthesis
VFVSLHEGFGMPIIEANATGRPVVCSAVCSLPEVAGDAALYIKDPTQIAQIRAGILKVISEDDTRQQLVERGLQNAKRFSNETITAAYEEMYANYLEA